MTPVQSTEVGAALDCRMGLPDDAPVLVERLQVGRRRRRNAGQRSGGKPPVGWLLTLGASVARWSSCWSDTTSLLLPVDCRRRTIRSALRGLVGLAADRPDYRGNVARRSWMRVVADHPRE